MKTLQERQAEAFEWLERHGSDSTFSLEVEYYDEDNDDDVVLDLDQDEQYWKLEWDSGKRCFESVGVTLLEAVEGAIVVEQVHLEPKQKEAE